MEQIRITINRDTFEHALNNLNFNEIISILDSFSIEVKEKKSKMLLKKELLERLETFGENVYFAIKSKAFSTNFDFFDGFFYKYNNNNIMLNEKNFLKAAKEVCDSYVGDVKFYITKTDNNETKDTIKFKIDRNNRKAVYDQDEGISKFYNQQIQAKVEILLNAGLIYIHSRNATDANIIKGFLQKVLKKKDNLIDESLSMKLQCPKFNNEIVETWLKENELNNMGLSTATLNMLDLLHSFNKVDAEFRGFSMQRIFFEHEVIDTNEDDCKVTGIMVDGINLQKHQDVLKEIADGKKIKGFSIEVEHCYYNDDEQEILSQIPITIMHENNHSIRISIASDALNIERKILTQAYVDIKNVFMEKLNATQVINHDEVLLFVQAINQQVQVIPNTIENDSDKDGERDLMVL